MMVASSAFVLVGVEDDGIAEGKVVVQDGVTYTTHAPIRIDGDGDFTAANGVTGGSGTEVDPWVIEGWEIDGTGLNWGIKIENTDDFFIISECYFNNYFDTFVPIYLTNVENGTINNTISKGNLTYSTAIGVEFSKNVIVANNTVDGLTYGIWITDSQYISIENNTFLNNSQLNVYRCFNSTIKFNIIDFYLKLQDSDNNLILGNEIYEAGDSSAISLFNSCNNLIKDNIIVDKEDIGIINCKNNTFSNNTINGDGAFFINGDSLEHWSTHTIDTTNTINGLPVYYLVNQNNLSFDFPTGQIICVNCTYIDISSQIHTNRLIGIQIIYSSYVIIENCNFSNNNNGIFLFESSNNTINNIEISDTSNAGYYCMQLYSSNNNTITNSNVVKNRTGTGLYLEDSNDNNLINNTLDISDYSGDTTGLKLINSNSNNIDNLVLSGFGHGVILRSYSKNNTINNSVVSDSKYDGFDIVGNNNIISNCTSFNNGRDGLIIQQGPDINITDCIVNYNGRYGIHLLNSNVISLSNSSITNNTIAGINVTTTWDFRISDNHISDNEYGIISFYSDYGIYCGNTIQNSNRGLTLQNSIYNMISQNYFNNNSKHAYCINSANDNYWNDVYPVGGNYWSDYTGFDENKDGFGDIPYVIDGGGMDNYPLMNECTPEIQLVSPPNGSVLNSATIIYFDIIDRNFDMIENGYSINGGENQSFTINYEIDTTTWLDNNYIIEVYGIDEAGNLAVEIYEFIIDSTNPVIILNSPANNTIILPGTIIDIDVIDDNIDAVDYSVNGGSNQPLDPTYDIDTTGWPDGTYIIEIHAIDDAGNTGVEVYEFMIDTTPPIIDAGTNATANAPYTQDATATDATSGIATYLWTQQSGPGNITFGTPDAEDTNISADTDGTYIIRLTVTDNAGNTAFDEFTLLWDTMKPNIIVNAPANNSLFIAGTILDFNVTDHHLKNVSYIVNGNIPIILSAPFDIDTTGWIDGVYDIEIVANDTAGNNITKSYTFTIDSTTPVITLNSPANNSAILPGTIIDFSVAEDNLDIVNYSINDGANQTLDPPYNINTTGWADGIYIIVIDAVDQLGHDSVRAFSFTIDGTRPTIVSTIPAHDSIEVTSNTTIQITFNEIMDTTSVENALSFDPFINVSSYNWLNDTILTITLSENLSYSTIYTILIGTNATDYLGNPLASQYSFSFTTLLDSDNDGIPDETDTDDDNDGISDTDDDFPLDPTEDRDTDGDGTGDNADTDDDGDGYLDEWEEFLGTDSLDSADTPLDTDEDGIPDGDANNTESWMDTDDDGDDVADDIDLDPLDPEVTDIIDDASDGDDGSNYFWLIILLVLAILGALLLFRRKPATTPTEEEIPPVEEEAVELETQLCPSCGFEIEPGQPCPFCPAEPVVEPTIEPEPEQPAPPHPNQKMLDRIEKAYKEGKMSEEAYKINMEKFSK